MEEGVTKLKKLILQHNGFSVRKKDLGSRVYMFKYGEINPEYKKKVLTQSWHKKDEEK
jgi:hypothetical protein|tara:strand:+ start:459 stop:632 length:174 start_codon:yes stop_codon:yes gene_type:complete